MQSEKMKSHLPEVDLEQLKFVLEVKEAYNAGKISLREAQEQLKSRVQRLKPYEIALAEQELKAIEEDECRKEDIQAMMDLFEGIMDVSRPELADDHPIMCYYRENDEMRRLLLAVEDLVQYPVIKNQWLELYDQLAQWRTHLSRKQNQLYSVLERKGFDRPTKTMWLLDDFIRDEIRDARQLLEQDRDDEFIELQPTLVADIRDLMQKEEAILYPTSLAMISHEEFEEMKSGDREIGFAWIQVGDMAEAPSRLGDAQGVEPSGFAADLATLLGKYGYQIGGANQLLDVTTGQLTLEQINLIYKHLPIDISFVDENELVCFYSDTDHRVFPRSKNVIGRDVKNCHPRTSVHLVEEIIEKFRSGEQDSVDFWINKPGLFIYIYYVAVRDAEGRFRGVLEMMQDCTRIRQLQDSRTLLKWSQDTRGASKSSGAYGTSESTSSGEERPSQEEVDDKGKTLEAVEDITAETKLKDLLKAYPALKDELPKVNSAFKMLHSPLARIIIPKATVAIMSERSGMPLDELIVKLREVVKSLK
ncbi:MAG: PAS domain-containing protein [Porphyromonadaceae bacterium]|nr:PAS domain-containing protein [Porphyromonadaceae bacterium]